MDAKAIKKADVDTAGASVPKDTKQSRLLSGGWDKSYAVAVVVVDNVKPKAEVHEKAVDVWRVLNGSGTIILGGKLVASVDQGNGEWVADEIANGARHELAEGDVIDIPPGVPHQFDMLGARCELLIVKIKQ